MNRQFLFLFFLAQPAPPPPPIATVEGPGPYTVQVTLPPGHVHCEVRTVGSWLLAFN